MCHWIICSREEYWASLFDLTFFGTITLIVVDVPNFTLFCSGPFDDVDVDAEILGNPTKVQLYLIWNTLLNVVLLASS